MNAMLNNRRRFVLLRWLCKALLLTGALFTLFLVMQTATSEAAYQPRILITEVLSSNDGVITDADGEYSDFIELHNAGYEAVNLRGWFLSDRESDPQRWRLPPITLEPGAYVLFFASGKDYEQADGVWHTNFRISARGVEAVVLTMPDGTLHHKVPPFESFADISFGMIGDDFVFMTTPTPGLPNAGDFYASREHINRIPQQLWITEYMTRNDSVFPDENGLYHDWVEIYNPGEAPVDLSGWHMTDHAQNPHRWGLQGLINPGEYLVLHFSGLSQAGHIPARLSHRDGELFLFNPNDYIVDYISLYSHPLYASFGRGADGLEGFFSPPTPGAANPVVPAAAEDEIPWHNRPTLLIMEYMSNNRHIHPDEDGDYNDWVEILNYGEVAVQLNEIGLSDNINNLNRWTFQNEANTPVYLLPGERVLVQLSGKNRPGHAHFALSENDSGLFLSDRFERIIDAVEIIRPPSHVSIGRDENDHDRWLLFPRPTPARPNDTQGFETLAGITVSGWGGLFISEASPDNWVEITNATEDEIQTLGWQVHGGGIAQSLPDTVLPPGEKIRINGLDIGVRGETLTLTGPDGHIADLFATGTLRPGITAGQPHAFSAERLLFTNDSRGQHTGVFTRYALPPYADVEDLIVEAGTEINLWTRDPFGDIYYTLDGTTPTEQSHRFAEPIIIESNTVLRAVVIAPSALPSTVLSRTYLVNAGHDLPVITLISDPDGLFSHQRGIFANGPRWTETFPHVGANFWQSWERETHFAFYENAQLRVESDVDMRIHGAYSRAEAQKSLLIFFRGDRGIGRMAYPFIPDIDRTLYDAFVLRTSGQDWRHTKLRDAFIHNAVADVTHLTVMAAAPVAVYINAEYWGLYNIRERINEDYFAINHGVANENVDILRGGRVARAGSAADFIALHNALPTMNMNTPEAYEYVDQHIDLDNWIDYWIVVTYFGNTDTGNIRMYRLDGGRWRWQLFDQDWAIWPSTFNWNPFHNMLSTEGHGVGQASSTALERALMRNDTIRNRFLERYAYLMRTALHPDRLIAILDEYTALIEPEMPGHIARWRAPGSITQWNNNINGLRRMIAGRPEQMKRFIRSSFNLSAARMEELFGD